MGKTPAHGAPRRVSSVRRLGDTEGMSRERTFNPPVASSSLAIPTVHNTSSGAIKALSGVTPNRSRATRSATRHSDTHKTCSRCPGVQPLDAFNADRTKKDGRQALCRSCQKGNYTRGDNRERSLERTKRYQTRNPEARRAHHAIEHAIKAGNLTRGFCECCGTEKTDAHHHNGYDKPLDVQWLCRSCHVTLEPRRGIREAACARIGNLLLLAIVVLIGALAFATLPPVKADARPTPKRFPAYKTCRSANLTPHQAIRCVFPRRLQAAARRVAECESTASAPERIARSRSLGRWARNGQYVGVFQMGRRERSAHGWYRRGAPAIVQVRSAYRLSARVAGNRGAAARD